MLPALFLTSMISLTISHGFDISRGSTQSMMLGSTSVGVYAMVFARVAPALRAAIESSVLAIGGKRDGGDESKR